MSRGTRMKDVKRKSHNKLKYCTKCEYVWEKYYCISNRMGRTFKYKELSSYKLPRVTCASCSERKHHGNINNRRQTSKLETKYC